ncbi:MAG: hypothetical protein KA777_03320 [Rhodoferax sp.]|nr:hypothetical protein [Rhodoferax sp.]
MTTSHQTTSTTGSESCKTIAGGSEGWKDRMVLRASLLAGAVLALLIWKGVVQ